ncbi:MAG TPA: hypothetical protein VNS61_05120, partial [Caldimonas sp.]|nr:hypothetical protein [Caldimonas sp.]
MQTERRLEAPCFVERSRRPARPRRLGENQDVERLALLQDVATGKLERALGRPIDVEREQGLLTAVKP